MKTHNATKPRPAASDRPADDARPPRRASLAGPPPAADEQLTPYQDWSPSVPRQGLTPHSPAASPYFGRRGSLGFLEKRKKSVVDKAFSKETKRFDSADYQMHLQAMRQKEHEQQ